MSSLTRALPLMFSVSFTACTGGGDSGDLAAPNAVFVAPLDGETVGVGDLALSISVSNFDLSDPAKHNDGEPTGYLQVDWTDGTTSESVRTGSTNPTINIPGTGTWTLTADLYFADGDHISEVFPDFVPATISISAQPGG
ncbi:MAG: hypothetical protein EXR69_01705 [Myxococcales bacterium]|nr:hypothetical protein [Myxococcales bacterium]